MTSRNLYTEQHNAGNNVKSRIMRTLLLAGMLLFGVQAIAQPYFTGGHTQSITICGNNTGNVSSNDLTSLLTADEDLGSGYNMTWTVTGGPTHGTVTFTPGPSSYSAFSGPATPVGITYTPTTGYVGTDVVQFTISDINGSYTTNITITSLAAPQGVFIPGTVCGNGSQITVTDGSSPGTYSTSGADFTFSPGTSGITTVTGANNGLQNIVYTLTSSGCTATAQVTVLAAPSTITGSSTVCTGAAAPYPTGLSVSGGAGTWATSNASVATVNSSGVVTGVSNGPVTISYTLTSDACYSLFPMTVYNTPLPITATTFAVCTGSSIPVASGTTGGIFSSSNSFQASITATGGPGSGTANTNGVSSGTPFITYTVPSGCAVTQQVTVNNTPSAISGASSVCVGYSTVLTDLTAGGAWSSSNALLGSVIASGAGAGTVTGVSAGAPNISYTITYGSASCYVVQPFNVYNNPAAIGGSPFTVCTGMTNTVTDATVGGNWTSSNTGLANFASGPTVGTLTGVSIGVPTISYTIPATGCYAIQSYTVNQTPVATTGASTLCIGATTTLTNTTGGGSWSTSDPLKATVVSGTGVVTGTGAGAVTISYVLPSGCYALWPMTINSNPGAITGPTTVCVGSSITALDGSGPGTWTSSNTSQASVVSGSGVITGLSAGTPTITFTNTATACYATEGIVVNTTPSAISGTTGICVGGTTSLSSSPAGGTWTSSNGVVASVSGAGLVTGLSAGTANITYALGTGCYATTTITVNPLPSAISGASQVCVGSTTVYTDGGGGVWTSSNPAWGTVGAGTGIVGGVAPGSPTITYTLPSGCSVTQVINVNANPLGITGTTNACIGLTSALSDGTAGPATWSSSNSAIASVGGTGIVTGVSAGTANISYTVTATGCSAIASFVVNSNPGAITGTMAVCTGATTALGNATGGGVWSSSDITKATVNAATGVVTGVAAGSATISYILGTSCYAVATVAVNQTPVAITGTTNVCIGLTTALSDATPGPATWTSSNTALATVAGNVVTGVAAGVPNITYSITATGCYTVTPVTVNPNPAVPAGTLSVCVGSTTVLTDATAGGTWSSSNTGQGTVGASTGIVGGISAGSPSIIYTLPTGCLNQATVVVNALPAAIAGTFNVCTGSTTVLTDATGGGTWSSSTPTMGSVIASGAGAGTVTGVATGVPVITYQITATGCYATQPVTVNQTPPAPTPSGSSICIGATETLSDATTGGLWSSSNPSFATVGAGTGTVTGVGAGTVSIIYTVPSGCTNSVNVVVNPNPAAITGTTNVCVGLTTTLSDATTPAGNWTSSNGAEATTTVGAGTSNVITGVAAGSPIITYTLGTGCYTTATITVNPNPAAITGAGSVCTGYTTTFASTTSGGTWSSSASAQGTVGATNGIVGGISPGTPTITYTLATGCLATKSIVVNQTPAAIAGPSSVCIGFGITLTDATTPAGTWSSSNAVEASVSGGTSTSNTITGNATGIPLITYTMGTGCYVTTPITVNPNPAAITGATSVCTGQTIGLSDVTAGGTWSSTDATKASVVSSTGVVTGVSATLPSPTISYTLATGCYATQVIVVNQTPAAITGTATVCTGFTTTLADATGTGTWSSSNPSEASVVAGPSASTVVSGVAAGTPVITYTLGSCYVTQPVVVNQNPPASTGTASVCVGATTVLSNTLSGGTWSSTNPGQASVGGTTGIVSGLAVGTPNISYTMPTGCYVITPVVVNPTPLAITGPTVVCAGSNITLSDATSGGVWSSGNTSTATIAGGTGIVTGVAGGVVTMSYTLGAGCYATYVITVNPVPNISSFTSTVATSECVGLGGVVTIASSSIGTGSYTVTYNLSGANAVTGASATLTMGATTGTFSIPSASLTGTGFTTVTITGISNSFSCTSVPLSGNTSTFTVYPLPTVYTVTGGGGYCVGGTGTHVYLSNSTGGVNYQLWLGATAVGTPLAGTFSGLDFGAITTVGTYTVTATNATTGCGSNMSGSATIFTNPLPTNTFTVTGGGAYCAGGSGVAVGLSSSQAGVSYQLYVSGVSTGSAVSGSGAAITFGNQTTAGVYTVIGTNTTTLCQSTMTGSQTVVINPLPAAITGTMYLCPGTTVTLADATSGGSWSSSTPGTATVGATTGVVTGAATPGTANIIYTLPTSCSVSATVTVNPNPAAISGLTSVCAGSAITLADATGSGNWTSSNPLIATANITTGVVTGVAAGTPSITYTLPATGCYATFNITVNPTPVAITGPNTVCVGLTATAIDLTAGGVWTSSSPSNASVGGGTGIVSGILSGTTTLTYTLPAGCNVTEPFTINPTPSAITGTATVCVGATTTLADGSTGGSWTSSNGSIATAGLFTGIITGVSAGTVTITYTLPAGCFITTTVTVNPVATAITGTNNVCVGLTTTLANTVPGGTWSSSNPAYGSVVGTTGVVTGVAAGSYNITYTLPAGCFVTFAMTTNPLPAAITGTTSVCVGLTTTLADATTSGTWSSSNGSLATVVSTTGVVTGVAAGNPNITYTVTATGCIITTPITVNPLPVAITGITTVCAGLTITLTDASSGGTWSSSNTAIGSVGSATGVVTGVAAGTATITYTLPTTCLVTTGTTVYPSPAPISGSNTVCVGLTTTLSDGVSGGTWSSSNSSLASVVGATGVVTGVNTGTPTITYTLPAPGSCFTTMVETVNPQPVAITGVFTVCTGLTTTLSDATTGGTWSSSNTSIATVVSATGVVSGIGAGVATLTYTLPAGCFVTQNVTVYPTPAVITGNPTVCMGLTTALADATTGGTWTSSNPGFGSVVATGVNAGLVTAVSPGTTVISYTLAPIGCNVTYTVTVNPLPAAIAGTVNVCAGSSTTLSDASAGGSWNSSNTAVATIGGISGIATGVSAGSVNYTYTLPTGCLISAAGLVYALPNIYTLTGGGAFCTGSTGVPVGLSGSDAGISYQLMNGGSAVGTPVIGTGSPISFGILTTAATYTVIATNTTTGCTQNMAGSATIAVSVLPTAYNMTGGGAYCAGSTGWAVGLDGSQTSTNYQLYLNGSIYTGTGGLQAGSGGLVSFGVMSGAGNYTVVATNTTTGCSNNMAGVSVIVVNPLPTAYTVTGGGVNCPGSTGVLVGLSNSQTGVNYTLAGGAAATLPGTTGSALSYGLITTNGTYTITGLNATTGCSNAMLGSASVTAGVAPTIYPMTQSGNPYCAGGAGSTLGLSGSQAPSGSTTYSYQLQYAGSSFGTAVTGTGAAFSFSPVLPAGTYSVKATNTTTGCTSVTTSSVTVVVNPLPPVNHITSGSGGTVCGIGGTGVFISMDTSYAGYTYKLWNGSASSGSMAGTSVPFPAIAPSSITFPAVNVAGTYTVTATNNTTLCISNMIGSATVNVALLPNIYTLSPTGGVSTYCAGGTGVTLTLSGSDLGVSYQLKNYTTSIAVGAPVAGTGGALVFGPVPAGNYDVVATNIATSCNITMPAAPSYVTVTTNPLPTAYTVSSGGSYCAGGTGVDITLSASQPGTTYYLYRSGTILVDSVLGTGLGLDFLSYTTAGTYTATASNITTGCTNNMSGAATVTVTSAPTAFSVTGGGPYCAGGTGLPVGLSGSVSGVNYQLYNGTTAIGPVVPGGGSAITFGNQTLGGVYTVKGISGSTGCTGAMTGSQTITVNAAPAAYTVTGGGGYCAGGTGVLVGLSGSDTGVTYQLYNGSTLAGTPVSGTGSAISFGLHTSNGIRTAIATRTSTGCTATMTGSVAVTINPVPAIDTVTGGGAYCPGGTGRLIGLNTGTAGINYILMLAGAPVGSVTAVTIGAAVSFGLHTGIGTYTVQAMNPTTTCTSNMIGTAVISNYALPTAYTVTGGGGYCTGGTGSDIQLSGSTSGVSYQLYDGTSTSGLAVTSTGGAIDFGNKTALGNYTVIATSPVTGCSNNMTGSVTVSLNPLPTAYNVTGGGSYCAGGAGLPIGLSNSDLTISYQLYYGGVMTGPALAGTGSALNFGVFTGSGTYTIVATNSVTGCISTMSGSGSISINPLPLVYNVTGGGSYCADGAGVPVNLSSSDAGISYQLKLGSANVGTPFGGVTGPLSFGNQTAAGTYTVVATNPVTTCTSNMASSASVSINPLPVSTYVVTGGGSYCAGGTGLNVGITGSGSGISYQLYNGTTATGLPQAGGSGAINFGLQTAGGTYTVVGTNTSTLCTSTMTGSVSITVNPLPVVDTVTGGGNYCPGGAGQHIGLSNSTTGVNYELYRGIVPLYSYAGTGTGLDFGLQTITGTYFVTATNASTGCSINMVGSPSIGISPLPTTYNVLASGTGYCLGGSGVAISLNGSDIGTQYQLYLGSVAVGGPVSGTGFTINYGLQTSAGTYKVIATSVATTCSSTMNDTPSVVINPVPSQYTVSGGGGFCAGGAGVSVYQGGSDVGINYHLWNGSTSVATVAGTGYSLTFGPETTSGTYTVVAVNATTGCTSNMLSSASVVVNPLPTNYFVVGGGSYCAGTAGVDIGVNASDSGINYQLYLGTTPVTSLAGTNGALNFGPQTTAGIYYVTATNPVTSCHSEMTDSATVSLNPLPAAFTVTGGGNYCTGGTGVNVGLSGTATGISYQLKLGSASVFAPVAGTGSAINFGLVTATGTYTVTATNTATGCNNAMASGVVVSVSALPGVYTVTGGGAYCASTTGSLVGLSGSDVGVNYELYNGTSLIPGAVAGTGGAISFGLHTAGTYSVVAVNATTTCSSDMTGTAVVSVLPSVVPSVTVSTGVGDTVCTGTTVTFSALTVNGGSLPTFAWSVNGILTGATGSSYTFVPSNGNVISVAMTSNEPCPLPATANGSVTMTVRADITPSVTIAASPSTTVCQGTTVDITATPVNGGTAPSYSWKLGGVPVGSGSVFTYIPSDGDVLFCTMTSSYQCVTANTVLSNNLTFSTQTSLSPVVTISLNSGANVGTVLYNDTLTAAVANPGVSPVYQWSVNGAVIPGAVSSVLYTSTLNDLDVVNCQVADSNACGYLLGSGSFTVHSANVGVKPVSAMSGDIRLVPNPNNGTFTIKGTLSSVDEQEVTIEVTNVLGQVIYSSRVIAHNGVIDEKVQMNNGLANGMYMVNVQSANESKIFHMVVEQ